ncbi:RNA 2',3'-cyclic phosphodiesterase [Patescibacteria group bacterium]|nr:RNA 2',3'-cyclic phosphodiesterase [Patescibacteria group bacterium]
MRTKHRIFIAINFLPEIKKEFLFYQKKWEDLPVRWTKKDNLHLTLVFIGSVEDEGLLKILETAREVAKNSQPFSIHFQRILLGPPDRTPRMFWVEGEKNQDLSVLKNNLEKELSELKLRRELREFKVHITIGRIKILEWRQLQKKPRIEEKISLTVSVNSIEVMESKLKPTGPDYFVLESIKLGPLSFSKKKGDPPVL